MPRYGQVEGFLHPKRPPNNPSEYFPDLFPHLNMGHEKLRRQLSGKDAGETLSRFGRATRRQNKEFHAEIHPLSGRMMTLSRGGDHSVRGRFATTDTQQRAQALAERTKNPEVKRRAEAISQPIGMRPGIRPISVHSHPQASGRTHPSGQDLAGGHEPFAQNVVASHRPDPARGGKNTSLVWHGRTRDPNQKEMGRLMAGDFGTQDKIAGADRKTKFLGAGYRALQRSRGGATTYDDVVRRQTGGRAAARGGSSSIYSRQQFVKALQRPVEYQPGQPLERYAAERRRRGVVAEGAAYGAGASAAGLGATMLGNAKIAGTRAGQHTLTQAENRLNRAGHPGAKQVGQVKAIGQWAAKRPRRTALGVAGLSTAAAGLGVAARMRSNEEAGISQGIGRIKAGESYSATQRRVTASKGLVRAALMASDADLNNPNIRRGLDIANRHGKKVVGGTLVGSGSVAAYASARGMSNRRKQAQQLRGQVGKLYVRDRQTSPVHAVETGAGLAIGAWGLGHSKMLGRALAHGVKQARTKQNPYAVEALQRAQAAQGLLAHHTARGERHLRQIRAVDDAVQRVPAAIRPEVAAAAGMLLVAQGHPVRRDTYHPVNVRVRGGF